jgi:DNA-binding XRE family transcriptional regulator
MGIRVRQGRPTTTIVGDNVYRHRVLRTPKMSQLALSKASGVSLETIRKLEQNREPHRDQLSPHLDTLDKLAATFGVDTSTLFRDPDAQ